MEVLLISGAVTAIGTAILTVFGVWKALTEPLTKAVADIKDSVLRLEARVESNEARRESDIKDIWKYLAERDLRQ